MTHAPKKSGKIALVCLLTVVLAALLALAIFADSIQKQPGSQRLDATTAAPTTTAAPNTTPAPTPAPTATPPESAPAPTDPAVSFTVELAENVTVWSDTLTVTGTAQPGSSVSVHGGGTSVETDRDGRFCLDLPLTMGQQSIALTCGEQTVTCQVERRYGMQSFSPSTKTAFHANQTMRINVIVKEGSTLTVEFRGQEVKMRKPADQLGQGAMDGYVFYTGAAAMPSNPQEEKNLGPITYTVTCDGITEVFQSRDVTCSAYVKNVLSDKAATPEGYWNVGSGYIVEITDVSVETLSGKGSHDKSDPRNNYLPKGTVDYGSEGLIYHEGGEQTYRLLRCGVRVYNEIKNVPDPNYSRVVDCYYGTLPDHNEIHIASLTQEGHHTYLTLDCAWKAPFYFDFEEQEYEDEVMRKFIVDKFDARYVDITFCYAREVTGDITIAEDHPLFSRAELIQNTSDMTLRLWLKTEGGLYGWDAYYNEDDQLVFQFLNPVTVTKADNAYGADLTGVVVMLDVGHGGEDIGAAGRDSRGLGWTEKERNLVLAEAVRKELESIGATVIMNRTTGEEVVTQRERIMYLKQIAPDYCLAIHHNSAVDKERNGFEAGFFTIFSQRATEHALATTKQTNIYKGNRLIWFYYYVSRQTICPVVLTENGFMSHVNDLEHALLNTSIEAKAKALTQGIANYYLEMNGLYTLEK